MNVHDTPADQLDEALRQLLQSPLPEGPPPELKASTVLAMSRQSAQLRRRRMLRYPAIAAALLVCVGALFLLLLTRATLTFAQVVQRVEQTKTLQGKQDDLPFYQGLPFYIKGNLERWEGNNPYGFGHWTLIEDRAADETFTIVPNQKTVFRGHGSQSIRGLYQMVRDVANTPVESLGDKVIAGRSLTGFSGSMKQGSADGIVSSIPVQIWVDPKTKLPVRAEIMDTVTGKVAGALTDLRFDEPIDDALFAMKVPEGYRVEDKRSDVVQHLKPASTTQQAQKLVLHPGVGIGDVKLGDPPAKLITLLGEPERKETYGVNGKEEYYHYPSLGLRVSIAWDSARFPDDGRQLKPGDRTVEQIWADSVRDATPVRDFPGATDAGIRIGSLRQEAEAAYGKPDWENMHNADYRKRGLAIFYGSDGKKVSGFMILNPSDQPIFGFFEDPNWGAPTTQPTTNQTQR